jgi:hypothetical protein
MPLSMGHILHTLDERLKTQAQEGESGVQQELISQEHELLAYLWLYGPDVLCNWAVHLPWSKSPEKS